MDENKKETLAEEGGVSGPEATPGFGSRPELPHKKNARLKKALIRAGAAFLAALILVGVTQFAFIDMLRGATENDAVQDAALGSFVKRDIFAILGFYPDDGSDGTATSQYALVPMSGKFVTVHFTKRYMESAEAVKTATYDYINGNIQTLDSYFVVEGTTATLSDELSTQMYDWFALNKDWMVEAGVISDTDDNAEFLSDVVLEVDAVKGMNETLVLVLTGLAAALLLYFFVELVLMAAGVYLDKPGVGQHMQAAGAPWIIQPQTWDNNTAAETVSVEKTEDEAGDTPTVAEAIPEEKAEDVTTQAVADEQAPEEKTEDQEDK